MTTDYSHPLVFEGKTLGGGQVRARRIRETILLALCFAIMHVKTVVAVLGGKRRIDW